MAIIYGKNTAVDYAAGNLASFGKSYSRMGAAPLDMTEVWYDKAALEEYAAYRGVEQADGSYDTSSVTSYVGQRVVYVNETEKKVYNYSIQLDGTLKEIGTSPVGDEKSIEVAANGTVSLKGIGSLVFEREVDVLGEDGQPTGEKKTEEIKYQPLMTKAGLTWVEPSKTTVEGLALLIEALSADVKALEGKVGKAAEGEKAATGLFKAIADEAKAREDADKALDAKIGAASVPETTEGAGDGKAATGVYVAIEAEAARAKAAEEALDEAIKAIDFMDSDEVADAIEEGIKNLATKQYVDDELAKKVNVETYNTDKQALVDEDAAIREIAEGVKARVDAFLDGEGTEKALDSLQELIAYIDEHDGADLTELFATVSTLEGKLENIDTTVVAYVTAAIDALKIGDYAKAADLTELAGKITALEGKVDVEKVSEAIAAAEGRASTDAQGKADAALEAAKGDATTKVNAALETAAADATSKANKALDDAKADAAELYATKAYVGTIPSNYTEKDVVSYINKKAEETLAAAQGGSSETAASVKQQLDNYKSENLAKFEKLEGIEAGAQVNVIDSVVASSTAKITATKSGKEVTIDDAALVSLIDAAKAQADKGVADAAEVKGIAEGAAGQAATNATAISGLDTRLGTAEGKINEHTQALATHASEYSELKGRVDAHDTAIADRALKSQVYTKDEVNAITGTPAEGKTLVGMIGDKANSADVYTKDQVYTKNEIAGITGTLAENKTLVDMINDAKTAATYNDTEVRGLISGNTTAIENITKAETGAIAVAKAEALKAVNDLEAGAVATNAANIKKNTDAIALLNGEAGTTGSVATIADARIAAALAGADADFDTLKEMSDWLSTHKGSAAEMNSAITTNTAAIKLINETTIPAAIATANKHTDDTIAALKLAETYEAKGAAASALTEAKGYTDEQITALGMANYTVKSVVSGHEAIVVDNVDGVVTIGFADEIVLNGGSAN